MTSLRANVKPLTHWLIYKRYNVRFSRRSPQEVTGTITTPENVEIPFRYEPQTQVIHLPDRRIHINEYGWEQTDLEEET